MTASAVVTPRKTFKGIMDLLKGPAILGAIALCFYVSWLAFRVGAALELEGSGGGLMVFLVMLGFIGGLVCIAGTIGLITEEFELAWFPPAVYAGALWAIIGIFFLIAGTTFPVQGEHPWVTRNGHVYAVGEEIPRGFLRRNGVPFAQTQEVMREVQWSDVAQNTGQQINFTTKVTFVSTIDPDSPALQARLQELLAQSDSLETINRRLWETYAPPVLTNPEILEQAVRSQTLTNQTTFETNAPWVDSFVVTAIDHRASLVSSVSAEPEAPATP